MSLLHLMNRIHRKDDHSIDVSSSFSFLPFDLHLIPLHLITIGFLL
jgi:hypothetical protein